MAGVTTTIDLGAPLQPILSMRDRINRGEASGTRLLVSGPWISRGAGGAMQDGFGGINISTPEEAAQQTETLAVAGVDHEVVVKDGVVYKGGPASGSRSSASSRGPRGVQ